MSEERRRSYGSIPTPVKDLHKEDSPKKDLPILTVQSRARNSLSLTHSKKANEKKRRLKRDFAVRAVVRFNFIAQAPGELTVHVGDVITVTDSSDFDWWVGHLPNGRHGLFPSNCCSIEADDWSTDSTPSESSFSSDSV